MEGVKRNEVRLLPHNPKWEEEFLTVRTELINCWGANIIDIQHIGSTAIKAISAKPILDIAIKLNSIKNMNTEALISMGYDYRGPQFGNENYHLFVLRGENGISLRHIHCYDKAEQEFSLSVGFRDYLNTHAEAASEYQKIKEELAERYPNDRTLYTRGKAEFIESIFSKL